MENSLIREGTHAEWNGVKVYERYLADLSPDEILEIDIISWYKNGYHSEYGRCRVSLNEIL